MTRPGPDERPTTPSIGGSPRAAWPGRRTLTRGQRVWVGVTALAVASFFALFLTEGRRWVEHPVATVFAAGCAVAGLVALVLSAWARRPDEASLRGSSRPRLPRDTRRALLRELRAGRPGPPALRAEAVHRTCRTLQAPWRPALFLFLAAHAAIAVTGRSPSMAWELVVLTVVATGAVAAAGTEIVRRRAARRVADALDELAAPPPPARA